MNQHQKMFILCLPALLLVLGTPPGTAEPAPTDLATTGGGLEPLPRSLEIELAESALPPHLREQATVYVLDVEKGFTVARRGTNGMHAFVARNDPGVVRGSWPYYGYRDDVLIPIAFDAAGAKAQMRIYFDMAKMQAEGAPPARLREIFRERLARGHYPAPERAGISYMLSPVLRPYVNPEQGDDVRTVSLPHYMFYAPNVSDRDIGGKPRSPEPWILNPGPHGYMIKFVGRTEKEAIAAEHAEMISALCDLRAEFCLRSGGTGAGD